MNNFKAVEKLLNEKHIEIPCPPDQAERLKYWCAHYGMNIKRIKRTDYYKVSNYKDLDLYWLGCNLTMQPFKTGTSEHK